MAKKKHREVYRTLLYFIIMVRNRKKKTRGVMLTMTTISFSVQTVQISILISINGRK